MAEHELLVLYRDITPSDLGGSDPKPDWTFSILAAHFTRLYSVLHPYKNMEKLVRQCN